MICHNVNRDLMQTSFCHHNPSPKVTRGAKKDQSLLFQFALKYVLALPSVEAGYDSKMPKIPSSSKSMLITPGLTPAHILQIANIETLLDETLSLDGLSSSQWLRKSLWNLCDRFHCLIINLCLNQL